MRVDRFDARAKLSQNKPPDIVQNVIAHLEQGNPALARRDATDGHPGRRK